MRESLIHPINHNDASTPREKIVIRKPTMLDVAALAALLSEMQRHYGFPVPEEQALEAALPACKPVSAAFDPRVIIAGMDNVAIGSIILNHRRAVSDGRFLQSFRSIGSSRYSHHHEESPMSVASRTPGTNLSAGTRPFTLAYRATARAVATVALWYRRAHDRRQLAVLSTSFPGFILDTGLVCTEADLWLRDWTLRNRRREPNDERSRRRF